MFRWITHLFTLVDRWRYGGDVDICAEGLPASKLIAGVPIMILEFLSKASSTTLTIFFPILFPTSLQAEPLEFND